LFKKISWQIYLGFFLITASLLLYGAHYYLFHDSHHIFIYLLGDIAFVPIEVLLVTLIIHRVLNAREKRSLLHKLNMVIGTFFSEVGSELIGLLLEFDHHANQIADQMVGISKLSNRELAHIHYYLKNHTVGIDSERSDLSRLKSYLLKKRPFLLDLLGNPNLLEHDSFTNLLWSVFHLTEELGHRQDFKKLPKSDFNHLTGDLRRVYMFLISEWLDYIQHLKNQYPYLFSLAVRINPFQSKRSVIITS